MNLAVIIIAVSGQECTDTVGSLSYDNDRKYKLVVNGQTFILAGYTVPCSGTVVAWEFCYRINGATSATFYPGIWRITETMSGESGDTDYTLVQSNNVTYNQSAHDPQDPTNRFACQIFHLTDTDQFTAPAGSVVGLYTDRTLRPLLLRTNTDISITTYRFTENQSSVSIVGISNDVDYNIAIRVHLGKYSGYIIMHVAKYMCLCLYLCVRGVRTCGVCTHACIFGFSVSGS